MKADNALFRQVTDAVTSMWKAYGEKDLEGVLGCYASDDDVLVLGSGADEVVIGLDQLRKSLARDFSQFDSGSASLSEPRVSTAGAVAWFYSQCVFQGKAGGAPVQMKGRFVSILERVEERWLLRMSQFSMPYEAQQDGESFPGAKSADTDH